MGSTVLWLLVTLASVHKCCGQWFADVLVQKGANEYQCGGIFGTFGPMGTVRGRILQAQPYTACEPLMVPSTVFRRQILPYSRHTQRFPGLAEPWIALVQRGGNCSFYDKIMYATAAGASAVIIGNVHMSEIVIMHDTRPVPIPAVSVSRAVASQLEITASFGDALATISTGPQLTMMSFVISEVLHDAAVFLVLLCGITSIVTIVYYFKRRRFLGQLAQRVWAKRAKVAAAVNLLPVVPYMSSHNLIAMRSFSGRQDPQALPKSQKLKTSRGCDDRPPNALADAVPDHCSICLDDFVPGDEHRGLPCPHSAHFHKDCIDPWLTRYMTCPLCKKNFLRAAEASVDIPLDVVEAATADDGIGEEISWEQLQQVDELEPVQHPATTAWTITMSQPS